MSTRTEAMEQHPSNQPADLPFRPADCCPTAQAVSVWESYLGAEYVLEFCGHHTREYAEKLNAQGFARTF
jgi:hypothetical protein